MCDCYVCKNAHTDPSLSPDDDLSYVSVGECDDGYRAFIRTGDSRNTALIVEHGNKLIWAYHPLYCPNCGRCLIENADRYKPSTYNAPSDY